MGEPMALSISSRGRMRLDIMRRRRRRTVYALLDVAVGFEKIKGFRFWVLGVGFRVSGFLIHSR